MVVGAMVQRFSHNCCTNHGNESLRPLTHRTDEREERKCQFGGSKNGSIPNGLPSHQKPKNHKPSAITESEPR